MLTCLRIRDLAIIDALDIELGPGLNVVTGETGAGKSMLVDALELVLGAKGKGDLVRTGAAQAEVEALFDIADDVASQEKLRALEVETDGELVIRRVLQPNGRARAFINGRLATAQQLAELVKGLADISSQHEHHTLSNSATHVSYLDAFAGLKPLRESLARAFAEARAHWEALQGFEAQVRDRAHREDLLRFQIKEIEVVGPQVGEESELQEQRGRLRHADALRRLSADAADALYDRDGSVSELLAQAAAHVQEAASLDPSLQDLAQQLEIARTQVEESARELGRYTRGVHADPERLAELDERLHALGKLKRKYGGSLELVVERLLQSRAELEALTDAEGTAEKLRQDYETELRKSAALARELSSKRKMAAERLAKSITEELASLGMGGARITVAVTAAEGRGTDMEVDGARLSAGGIDRVEFLIAPNKGELARPLSKIASGGELSRAMLAIKRVLAGIGPAGMYVFDEVDTGVGGAIAEVIGRKIHDVAQHRQVLCVTHLPQIAAFADAHFKVEKAVVDERTRSSMRKLSRKDQEEELARMLGGLKITAKTRAVAAEMLRDARTSAAA
jgi:DNA repair protein RecN (Recombination protein N)